MRDYDQGIHLRGGGSLVGTIHGTSGDYMRLAVTQGQLSELGWPYGSLGLYGSPSRPAADPPEAIQKL